MISKKEIRINFRKQVFERDKYSCVCCGKAGKDRQGGEGHKKFHKNESLLVFLDAHHIISRKEMPYGGYVKENGISVCDECHLKAEDYWCNKPTQNGYTPEDLFKKIGSSKELAKQISEKNLVP